MKKSKWLWISLAVLVILACSYYFLFMQADSSKEGGKSKGEELTINGFVVDSLTMWETITRNGVLIADDETDLSFETAGKIVELNIKEGKQVRKGEVLARLNDEVLKAELLTYEAKLPLAEKKLKRQRALVEQDAASVESVEELETELNFLKASIQLVNSKIRQTVLVAPFDGVIGLKNISLGAYVTTSTPVVKIAKNSPLKIEFSVPNKYLSAIRDAKDVSFTTANVSTPHFAKIYAFDAKIDESNTLIVRAEYDNKDALFVPGEFASVVLKLNEQFGSLAVPNEAMTATTEGSTVFLCKNGKVQTRVVQTGIRTDTLLQITDGLSLGDTIAVTGLLQLHDGMSVKINIKK